MRCTHEVDAELAALDAVEVVWGPEVDIDVPRDVDSETVTSLLFSDADVGFA